MARARYIRCNWPPERVCRGRPTSEPTPSRPAASAASAGALLPASSSAPSRGNRPAAGFCGIQAQARRRQAHSAGERPSRPPTRIEPVVWRCRPSTARSSVDLPEPLVPVRATRSPAAISRSTSATASTRPCRQATFRMRTSSPPITRPSIVLGCAGRRGSASHVAVVGCGESWVPEIPGPFRRDGRAGGRSGSQAGGGPGSAVRSGGEDCGSSRGRGQGAGAGAEAGARARAGAAAMASRAGGSGVRMRGGRRAPDQGALRSVVCGSLPPRALSM